MFTSIGDTWGMFQATLAICRALAATGRLDELAVTESELARLSEEIEDPAIRHLGLMVRTMVAVHLGDVDKLERVMAEHLDDDDAAFAFAESRAARAFAELQLGRVDLALERVREAVAAAVTDGDRAYTTAVSALVAAAAGRTEDIPDVVESDKTLITQPNRFTIAMARGFAALQKDRPDEAREALESAQRIVDATDTYLDRELVRLARGWLLTALDDPDAADVLAEARTRLAGFGTRADGWERVFRMCAGLGANPDLGALRPA